MRKTREITTIPVRKTTKEMLKTLGLKGQTYDEILMRLMERVGHEEFMERQYARLKEKAKFVPLDEI